MPFCGPAKRWAATYPGKAWQKKRWSLKEIDQAFKVFGELNVGVLFGPESGLIDIEEDSPEDRAALLLFPDAAKSAE